MKGGMGRGAAQPLPGPPLPPRRPALPPPRSSVGVWAAGDLLRSCTGFQLTPLDTVECATPHWSPVGGRGWGGWLRRLRRLRLQAMQSKAESKAAVAPSDEGGPASPLWTCFRIRMLCSNSASLPFWLKPWLERRPPKAGIAGYCWPRVEHERFGRETSGLESKGGSFAPNTC